MDYLKNQVFPNHNFSNALHNPSSNENFFNTRERSLPLRNKKSLKQMKIARN